MSGSAPLILFLLGLMGCPENDTGKKPDGDADTDVDTDADADADADTDTDVDTDTDADTGPVDDDGDGWTLAKGDCDDGDRSVHPGASERVADGIDQNCDGGEVCYQGIDADGDGYAVADTVISKDLDCTDPGEAATGGDCDDGDPGVHPEAEEICEDGVDDDCDGRDSRCDLAGEISLSTADATFLGEREWDYAGGPLATGDVDGDGDDDILIGSQYEDSGGQVAGAAYLLLGPSSGITSLAEAEAKFVGEDGNDRAGSALAAGDISGDGIEDVLIGAIWEDSGGGDAGAAYLLAGPISGTVDLSAADAKFVGEDNADSAGSGLAAGDVDGDGIEDVLVGALGKNASTGAVYMVSGPISGTVDLSVVDAEIVGEHSGDYVGMAVDTGDVDGDGIDDIVLGSFQEETGGPWAGAAYLVLGPVSGTLVLSTADAKLIGEAGWTWAGWSVATGDVDGDGMDNILVGACSEDSSDANSGAVYVVSGPPSGSSSLSKADAKLLGEGANARAGYSIASGDLDGDEVDDILVGACGDDSSGRFDGTIYIVLGPTTGTQSLSLADVRFMGEESDNSVGCYLSAGDVDADGTDDVLVGDTEYGGIATSAGVAYLVYGVDSR